MGSWSGLRKHIRERLAESLKDRVDFHYTVYESTNRHGWKDSRHWSFWITVEGEERLRLGCCGPILPMDNPQDDATRENSFGPDEAIQSLIDYLNLSIEDALTSKNVLIRGLAYADSRVGKRRLEALKPNEGAHDLVKFFFHLRAEKAI